MDNRAQIENKEKSIEHMSSQNGTESKEVKRKEVQKVSKERIERMKKAFKPSWLYDQINSSGR